MMIRFWWGDRGPGCLVKVGRYEFAFTPGYWWTFHCQLSFAGVDDGWYRQVGPVSIERDPSKVAS